VGCALPCAESMIKREFQWGCRCRLTGLAKTDLHLSSSFLMVQTGFHSSSCSLMLLRRIPALLSRTSSRVHCIRRIGTRDCQTEQKGAAQFFLLKKGPQMSKPADDSQQKAATSAAVQSAAVASVPAKPSVASPVSLRSAHRHDALALSIFARRAFIEQFGADNDPEAMKLYCEEEFNEKKQREEIEDPKRDVFLAEIADEIVGYAMTNCAEPDPCVTDRSAIEFQRIYGVGHGHSLLCRCISHALWLGRETAWLGVEAKNTRAVAFYRKYGFVDCGEHVFRLGKEDQMDRIMQRRLDSNDGVHPLIVRELAAGFYDLGHDAALEQRIVHAIRTGAKYDIELDRGLSALQVSVLLHEPIDLVKEIIDKLEKEYQVFVDRDTGVVDHWKVT
jgi:GNAT superfamily N-acetyltransferase